MIGQKLLNYILGGLLLVTGVGLGIQTWRLDSSQDYIQEYKAEIKQKLVDAYRANEEERAVAAQALAKSSQEYLRGKRDAEKLGKDVVASLVAANTSVRKHWREALRRAEQAEATGTDGGGDGEADAMRRDFEGIVRRAAEADASIVQLQNRIDTYLKQVNGTGYYERYSIEGWTEWSLDITSDSKKWMVAGLDGNDAVMTTSLDSVMIPTVKP